MVGNTSIEMEENSKYKIYFYSKPYFLVLDKDDIKDINLKSKENTKFIEINYADSFFDLNLKHSKSKEWALTVQAYDKSEKFISQIDVYGENLKSKKIKNSKILELEYDQITNNKGWSSIPKVFEDAEIVYQNSKKTYFRDLSIKKILD